MTAKITRLRIAGFKSFADAATIDILPGLTGIVGPNGCGKSNVVEALRWAMGESSARALRGSELDDLIFAGTSARPARSLADVTLWLDDAKGLAPPPFNDTEELEISRRAERGAGSEFRLNGRALRARDITTMFADLSSGARSSSIVSQNRVSALISAKPEERRSLLEEAAGITGLHARRHDAELKLRQAESNMERSEDLRQQIDARLATLEAQSIQAQTYRALSESIRENENALTWLVYKRAENLLKRTQEQLDAAETTRDQSAHAALIAGQESETGRTRLLTLRDTVDTLRSTRDRLRVMSDTTKEALLQAQSRCTQAGQHHDQILSDQGLSRARLDETLARHEALLEEQTRLDTLLSALPDRLAELRRLGEENSTTLAALEKNRSELAAQLMSQRMAAHALTGEHEAHAQRIEALTTEDTTLAGSIADLQAEMPDDTALQDLQNRLNDKRQERAQRDTEIQQLAQLQQEQRIAFSRMEQDADRAEQEARENQLNLSRLNERISTLDSQINALQAETETLEKARLSPETLAAYDEKSAALLADRDQARHDVEQARAALAQIEQDISREEAESRSVAQQRTLLETERNQAQQALERLTRQITALTSRGEALQTEMPALQAIEAASSARQSTQERLSGLNAEIERLSHASNKTRQAHDAAEKALRHATAHHLALKSRLDALNASAPGDDLPETVLAALDIPAGLEKAVAAALGLTLEASLDPQQNRAWLDLPFMEAPPLPGGSQPLAMLLGAPRALARRLAHIGLIEDPEQGGLLQNQLVSGQYLVSRDGALWRWDGYREAANLPSKALGRVEHLATLRQLENELAAAAEALPTLETTLSAVAREDEAHITQLSALREAVQQEEKSLSTLREEEAILLGQRDRIMSQMAQLDRNLAENVIQRDETTQRLEMAQTALGTLTEGALLQTRLDTLKAAHAQARNKLQQSVVRSRALEAAHDAAQEEATRLRLQNDANRARLATLETVLSQSRRDREDLHRQKLALTKADYEAALTEAHEKLDRSKAELEASRGKLEVLRSALETCSREIGAISRDLQGRRDLKLSLGSRLAALAPRHESVRAQLAEARLAQEHLAPVPDLSPLELALTDAQAKETAQRNLVLEVHEQERDARARFEHAQQEKDQIALRLGEASALCNTLRDDLSRLEERVETSRHEMARFNTDKVQLEEALETNTVALAQAEKDHEQAHAALIALEEALQTLDQTQREEEQRCAQARESVIRLQERLAQASTHFEKLAETPQAELQASPDMPLTEQSEISLKRRLARSQKEREALGPVNLLAEQEHAEAQAQSAHLAREHEELGVAINRLRGSINALRKEGRERLQAVFVEVDQHFQSLFSRMFDGGKAHLGLVGNDDPLEAGLEIFAQPPGKKLSTLSLLSGGEQALTALSLIFATFRCQPSPICILDEVDAPLDDANVERLCSLLKDMAEEAQTRFLIVTHHQLTMAHMDRLYGVTMQERGVSQVLSVDLSVAPAFIENGPMAVA